MLYSVRNAVKDDYQFLFELKKAAEFDAVKAVFGWNEEMQLELHACEWSEASPKIIEVDNVRVGSYLLLNKGDHFYFGRYFLLPQYQGKGIGSKVLQQCIAESDTCNLPIKLCYLQGNRVGSLYERNGFKTVNEDEQFVYMERQP